MKIRLESGADLLRAEIVIIRATVIASHNCVVGDFICTLSHAYANMRAL